jgi:hypothetical protein
LFQNINGNNLVADAKAMAKQKTSEFFALATGAFAPRAYAVA